MGLTKTYRDGTTPTVAIIGAGMSGLCAAIQLQRELQLTTYTVYELEAEVGGTWLNNSYPGCQSDAPVHLYSYSFAPNYNFSRKFVKRQEVLDYLRATAKTYSIYDKIQFRTRITSMQWHEGRSKWILRWSKGSSGPEGQYEVDVVMHGAGVLRLPNIPKEFDAFEGLKWHSASAIQIVPAIADKVKSLDVYGKSPSYITPQCNVTYNSVWRFLFRFVPFFYTLYRTFWYYYVDSTILLYHKLSWRSAFHRAVVYFVTWFFRFIQLPLDKDLREKSTPDYELASRRVVLSDNYFPTLKKPHVALHRDPIASIDGKTIETLDGSKQELDVIVLATGFEWVSNFPVGYWTGKSGVDIATVWGESPTTYYGTCVPEAPNFFLIWGPNAGIAHHALTSMVEIQVMYAIQALSYMMEQDLESMEIKQEAADKFLEILDMRMERMLFTTEVQPKFVNSQKKCRGFWWGSVTEFWWHMRHLHPERFHVTSRRQGKEGGADKSHRVNGSNSRDEKLDDV
ncbi:hypothetical protein BGZ98_003437 [Dissophora globulifera]|nr:hypothetical protein BGZ98_003437 [Dissophora globulifera]